MTQRKHRDYLAGAPVKVHFKSNAPKSVSKPTLQPVSFFEVDGRAAKIRLSNGDMVVINSDINLMRLDFVVAALKCRGYEKRFGVWLPKKKGKTHA